MPRKKVLIINGPNLNLLGTREPEIYGKTSFTDYMLHLEKVAADRAELVYFQSNSEGGIIDAIQKHSPQVSGIIINGGAYTHTSVAIRDALANVRIPKVEVHISNVHNREEFRHFSYFSAVCDGVIVGLGLKGYDLALLYILGVGE